MDKRWRNLGIIVVVVIVFLILFFNAGFIMNFFWQDDYIIEDEDYDIELSSEKMFGEILNVFLKNNVDINKIIFLENIDYENESYNYAFDIFVLEKTKSDLISLKSSLPINYSEQLSFEGKSVINVYIMALDFMIFEKNAANQIQFIAQGASQNYCDNIDLMSSANDIIQERYFKLEALFDAVQEHSLDFDWSSEIIIIDIEKEEAAMLLFEDDLNSFVEVCQGGLN